MTKIWISLASTSLVSESYQAGRLMDRRVPYALYDRSTRVELDKVLEAPKVEEKPGPVVGRKNKSPAAEESKDKAGTEEDSEDTADGEDTEAEEAGDELDELDAELEEGEEEAEGEESTGDEDPEATEEETVEEDEEEVTEE